MKKLKNKYTLFLGVQAIALLIILVMLFLPKYSQSFGAQDFNVMMGTYAENGDVYTDNTITPAGVLLTTPEMDLGYGSYVIEIDYYADNDGNLAYITLPDIMEGRENINDRYVTNTAVLSSASSSEKVEVLINRAQKDYKVAVFFLGNGALSVNSISVYETNAGILRIGVILVTVFALLDAGVLLYHKRKRDEVSIQTVRTGFFLVGISVFASIPLFLTYMIEGHDLTFHLLRIEGLKEGMEMGVFPIKIQPNWLNGNGYATSVFYGDMLLYIPAILRLCGFNITESYNIYVFLTNLATCFVSYYCFYKISRNNKAALAGSMLYTLSLYRMINIYIRSAVGEYSAMIFLPLIVYGMWKIFTEDINEAGYKKNWIIPVIGFSGIINTHILTCEMVGAFIILLCLILIKKVFKKETFIVLVKIVVYTCIVNIGFLVPFFDYMLEGGFIVTNGERFTSGIQQFGAYIGQLFVPFTTYEGLSSNVSEGMAADMPASTGLALIIGSVIFIYALVAGYMKDEKYRKYKVLSGICFGFGVLSLLFSTHVFPWDLLQDMNGLFETLISMISMPWRFLSIASIVLAVVTVVAINVMEAVSKENAKWIIAALAAICAIQSGALMSDIMNNAEPLAVYSDNALDDSNVIGGEYLPSLGSLELYQKNFVAASENMEITGVDRENNEALVSVINSSSEDASLQLSMVYYKGYTAKALSTGEKLQVYPHEAYTLGVIVPAGYTGDIKIEFTGFWYWKLAAVVSIISVIGVAVLCYKESKRNLANK